MVDATETTEAIFGGLPWRPYQDEILTLPQSSGFSERLMIPGVKEPYFASLCEIFFPMQ